MAQPLSRSQAPLDPRPLRDRLRDDTMLTVQVIVVIFSYLFLTLLLSAVVNWLPTLIP